MRTFSVILILNISTFLFKNEHLIITYNVYNDNIFTGGWDESSELKDILQYNTASHTWEEVGQMKEARSAHGVGVLDDVSQLCP